MNPARHVNMGTLGFGRMADVPLAGRSKPLHRAECATPRCHESPAEGGRFCADHTALLARVREELAEEGLRSVGNGRRKRVGPPRCCTLGCFHPRLPPSAFCESCSAGGVVEGE